jgi:hypothetical protein
MYRAVCFRYHVVVKLQSCLTHNCNGSDDDCWDIEQTPSEVGSAKLYPFDHSHCRCWSCYVWDFRKRTSLQEAIGYIVSGTLSTVLLMIRLACMAELLIELTRFQLCSYLHTICGALQSMAIIFALHSVSDSIAEVKPKTDKFSNIVETHDCNVITTGCCSMLLLPIFSKI